MLAVRDLVSLAVHSHFTQDQVDSAMTPLSLLVLLASPLILKRVLNTEPLPAGVLRDHLASIAQRSRVRFRDILLWKTDQTMGNAAVLGMLPRVALCALHRSAAEPNDRSANRSGLRGTRMRIRYRHMLWYLLLVGSLFCLLEGPVRSSIDWALSSKLTAGTLSSLGASITSLSHGDLSNEMLVNLIFLVSELIVVMLVFGFVLRRFERQADVFAARTVATENEPPAASLEPDAAPLAGKTQLRPVDALGAQAFAGALHELAVMNSIPTDAFEWIHGSIDAGGSSCSSWPTTRRERPRSIGRCAGCTWESCCCACWRSGQWCESLR